MSVSPGLFFFAGAGRMEQTQIPRTDNPIDRAILKQFAQHPDKALPQNEVVRALLSITTEGYGYARIRQLEGQGYIVKAGPGNRKTITLTQAGQAAASGRE